MGTKTAQKKLEQALQIIKESVTNKKELQLNLGYDLLSGKPCLKVGFTKVSSKGSYLKPEHIETFIGPLTVSHALAAILAAFPSEA